MSEKDKKVKLFQRVFPENVPMETWKAVLTYPSKYFRQTGENFSLNVQKWWKKLFKKRFPLNLSLWTREMQFLQPCRKKLLEGWNLSVTVVNFKKIDCFFQKRIFLNVFLWTRRMQFWQPRRKVCDIRPKVFRPISEKIRKSLQFTVEYKWNRKISQIRTQLKTCFLLKIVLVANLH